MLTAQILKRQRRTANSWDALKIVPDVGVSESALLLELSNIRACICAETKGN